MIDFLLTSILFKCKQGTVWLLCALSPCRQFHTFLWSHSALMKTKKNPVNLIIQVNTELLVISMTFVHICCFKLSGVFTFLDFILYILRCSPFVLSSSLLMKPSYEQFLSLICRLWLSDQIHSYEVRQATCGYCCFLNVRKLPVTEWRWFQ